MRPHGSGRVAGVVLAAGTSTRMGRNKMLLRIEGESLVRRAVRRGAAAGLDPILVVLGHEAEGAERELSGLAFQAVINSNYERGINSSLRAGIAAVPEDAPAAVVLLADMPFVTEDMIATLLERYRQTRAPLVLSEYGGAQAPPTLYDRTLFAELRETEGEGCGQRVARRHRSEAVAVAWPAEALTDLDRPEDYERVKTALAARQTPCGTTS